MPSERSGGRAARPTGGARRARRGPQEYGIVFTEVGESVPSRSIAESEAVADAVRLDGFMPSIEYRSHTSHRSLENSVAPPAEVLRLISAAKEPTAAEEAAAEPEGPAAAVSVAAVASTHESTVQDYAVKEPAAAEEAAAEPEQSVAATAIVVPLRRKKSTGQRGRLPAPATSTEMHL